MTWRPREEQLEPWTRRALEEAYQGRERARCSRDDFRDGFLSALLYLRSKSSFKTGEWAPDEDELPW
jgi:hypothetical protein